MSTVIEKIFLIFFFLKVVARQIGRRKHSWQKEQYVQRKRHLKHDEFRELQNIAVWLGLQRSTGK